MKQVPEQLLYTVEDTAAALSIGTTKVKDLIQHKELRSIKIGVLRRIPVSAVREYIAIREMEEAGG